MYVSLITPAPMIPTPTGPVRLTPAARARGRAGRPDCAQTASNRSPAVSSSSTTRSAPGRGGEDVRDRQDPGARRHLVRRVEAAVAVLDVERGDPIAEPPEERRDVGPAGERPVRVDLEDDAGRQPVGEDLQRVPTVDRATRARSGGCGTRSGSRARPRDRPRRSARRRSGRSPSAVLPSRRIGPRLDQRPDPQLGGGVEDLVEFGVAEQAHVGGRRRQAVAGEAAREAVAVGEESNGSTRRNPIPASRPRVASTSSARAARTV